MVDLWINNIADAILQRGRMRLTELGHVVPRPTNVPRNKKLLELLSSDVRFEVMGQGPFLEVNLKPHARYSSSKQSNKLAEEWQQTLESYLRRENRPVFLSHLGSLIPRPVGLATKLLKIIQSDPSHRFEIHKIDNRLAVCAVGCVSLTIPTWTELKDGIEQNREGIEIQPDKVALDKNPDGSNKLVPPGSKVQQVFKVRNGSGQVISFLRARLSGPAHDDFKVLPLALPTTLHPSATQTMTLECIPTDIRVLRTTLLFEFSLQTSQGVLTIGRFITVRCADVDVEEILQPKEKFQRIRKRKAQQFGSKIIEGEKPSGNDEKNLFPFRLLPYEIPRDLRSSSQNGSVGMQLQALQAELPSSYAKYFSRLLWIEEMQMECDIRFFDIDGAKLNKSGAYLALQVPGLSEHRPSVLRGDSVLATPCWNRAFQHKGYAHRIERDRVLLKFNKAFHEEFAMIGGRSVDITFSFRRTPLRLMHQGVNQQFPWLSRMLFPDVDYPKAPPRSAATVTLFNRSLNDEQRKTVIRIVQGISRPVPYIIFGPPGTGKTVTLVESILQLRKLMPPAFRILVTAPSNTAADLFVLKLKDIPKSEMFRMMAFNRNVDEVSETVREYSLHVDEHFEAPTMELLKKYQIVVATCCMASKLYNMGLPRGHFDAIFVDECGNAMEPEVEAAIACLASQAGNATQLVFAGDPKQLGPVVRSMAKDHGLATSILERLMNRDIYKRDDQRFPNDRGYDPCVLTKLVRNYRSHPSIIALPNTLFYDNDLQASADRMLTHSLANWEHLPKRGFPVIFHSVEGLNDRECNSPSWFNTTECAQVLRYVQHLIRDTKPPLQPRQIGIIAPYAKQAEKLRIALNSQGIPAGGDGIMVGSTEQFQGQERRVIIISTVRSDPSHLESDAKHNLGFLDNPKRFNVAVTRAQALLIIVGNGQLLAQDEHWGKLLWYCVDNGAYIGGPPPPRHQVQESEYGDDSDDSHLSEDGPSRLEELEGPAWRDAD